MPRFPKVSIIMPVYNGGDYFELALKSAVNQTYHNLEIVVVDDGSQDEGRAQKACLAQCDRSGPVVRYIRQKNGGAGSALNTGISAMTGDIFCWLSHDDLFLPQKVERQVAYWTALERSDAILISDYDIIDEHGEVQKEIRLDHAAAIAAPRLPLFAGWINGCTIFAPKSVLGDDPPFDPQYRYVQDYRLWFNLVQEHEIFHQAESLVRYRVHSYQDSHKPEAVAEGDAFWIDALGAPSAVERAQLFGSTWRFYDAAHRYLSGAGYKQAAHLAAAGRDATISDTLVSVILPVGEGISSSLTSVLSQSHANLEVLLVGGLGENLPSDQRVRWIGSSAADRESLLELGLAASRGEYVCFLEPGDAFLSERLERQLETLQRSGAVFGYTSFYAPSQVDGEDYEVVAAGRLAGNVESQALIERPLSTLMAHRLLIAEGWSFARSDGISSPPTWAELATRRPVFGLDDPLVVFGGDAAAVKLQPRVPFDPETHMGERRSRAFTCKRRTTIDPSAADNAYRNGFHSTPNGVEVGSGREPWDYVAVLRAGLHGRTSRHLQLTLNGVTEDLYALLVDANFNPLGERQVASSERGAFHDLWFEVTPQAHAVVIQAGPAPTAATFMLTALAVYGSDDNALD